MTLRDADGERVLLVSRHLFCGFATIEHMFNSRRVTGASETAVPFPPGLDGVTDAVLSGRRSRLSPSPEFLVPARALAGAERGFVCSVVACVEFVSCPAPSVCSLP